MIDKDLEERMQMAQDVSSMVLALRRKVNIKVRQPLQTIMVPVVDAHQQESIEAVKALILNEVNVKELKFVDNAAGILVKKIKPDFKKLGPRYGKIMKALAAAIQAMSRRNHLRRHTGLVGCERRPLDGGAGYHRDGKPPQGRAGA